MLSGDRYLSVANDNRVRTIRLEAPRGPIVDRNGRVLVGNVAGTRVELWPADLPRTLAGAPQGAAGPSPTSPARPCKEMLAQLNAHGDDPLTPVVVQRGLRRDQIDYLSEHSLQFPGVQMQDSFLRSYPYQSLAAQVVGYVGAISPGAVQGAEEEGLPGDRLDRPGRRRVDLRHVSARQGREGAADGRLSRPAEGRGGLQTNPTPGEALKLTIDINLQRAAERALRYGIAWRTRARKVRTRTAVRSSR